MDELTLNPQEPQPERRSWLREGLEYIGELVRVIVISLAIIIPIRYFLVQPFYVKGASMEPNFYDHEYLVIDEISYRFREPHRGEIVVFRYPKDPTQFFIKRVVGLSGEMVSISGGHISIKNAQIPQEKVLEESYLDPDTYIWGESEVVLNPDEYYLLGDNRASSLDSRQFGPIKRELIVGRVWLRGWPLDRVARFLAPTYTIDKQGQE